MEFLKQNFNVQSLRKTGAISLPSMWLKDCQTKVKTSRMDSFCYFWPKMGKLFVLMSFKYGVSSLFSLPLPLRYFCNQYILLVNVYLIQNMKKTNWNTSFFPGFSQHLDLIWPKFCPKDHTHFTFLRSLPMKYVKGFNYNPVVLKKKLAKPKNCFFEHNFHKKGVIMGHTQNGKQFF